MQEQAIERGSALLDRERPGWHREINPETLDIQSVENCVLGQCYGMWEEGLDALGIRGHAISHGFVASEGAAKARELWLERIEARLLMDSFEDLTIGGRVA